MDPANPYGVMPADQLLQAQPDATMPPALSLGTPMAAPVAPQLQDHPLLGSLGNLGLNLLTGGTYQLFQAQNQRRQMVQTAQQMALAHRKAEEAAIQEAITKPSAQAYQNLLVLQPEHAAAIKDAYGMMDEATQRSSLRDMASIWGYLDPKVNDTKSATAVVQRQIDADKRAGKDTSQDQALMAQITASPEKARAFVGTLMTTISGADKMAEVMGKMGGEARAQAEEPSKLDVQAANLAKTKAETAQITNPRPEWAPDGLGGFYNKNATNAPSASAGAAVGNSGVLTDFVTRLQASENGTGDPAAKNPKSSATGNGQFIEGTWLPLIQQLHPELTQGKSREQILALRTDPTLSREATAAYAQQNAQALQSSGLPVSGASLAMAHKLGPQGAMAVLQASPDAPLSRVLPPEVMAANPQLKGKTAGQYGVGLANQFGSAPLDATPGDPTATGEAFLKTLPPGRARMIQGYADGRLAFPSGFSATRPAGQLLLDQIAQYDPSFDASDFKSRSATRRDFTSGKAAASVTALNAAIGHLGNLDQRIDGLGNYGLPLNNWIANGIGAATGTRGATQVKKFEVGRDIALEEVNKFLIGTGGALQDREEWKKKFSATANPDTLHAEIGEIVNLLGSKLDSLGEQYNRGMGKSEDPLRLINPHAAETLAKLRKDGGAIAGASSAPPAYAKTPQGQLMQTTDGGKTWKPVG
jgi:hypothetical protein